MPNVQIREVPDDVHEALVRKAELAGQSLQQYLSAQLVVIASTPTVDEVLEAYFASSGNAGIDPVSGPTANGTLPAGGVVTHSWFPQAQGRYTVTLSALSADAELVIPAAPQCERGSGARSSTRARTWWSARTRTCCSRRSSGATSSSPTASGTSSSPG